MSKKSLILLVFAVIVLSSCGTKSTASSKNVQNKTKTVNDVLNEKTNKTSSDDKNHGGTKTNPNDNKKPIKIPNGTVNGGSNLKRSNTKSKALSVSDIDVDLTTLSATMVYSEVNNMMTTPENYVGKTVRMDGKLAVYEYPERNYYTCIIKDATACCQQGMEFLWAGDHKYPEDYPKEGDGIIVTGVFDIYYEGDSKYVQLKDATLVRSKT